MRVLALLMLLVGANAAYAEREAGLEAALRATMSRHPGVSGKVAELQAKGYAGDSARAQRYPSLSVQAGVQDNNTKPSTLRARQPLWAFGRIDSNIAYADADYKVNAADLLRVQRQLLDQAAVAYARLLGAQQRLRVAEDNVASLDRMYQQIHRREEGQLASRADVRLANSRLLQAQAQQARFAGELEVAQTELLALTQIPVQTGQSLPDTVLQLPDVAVMEGLAQEHSADVILKAERVALAQADVDREQTAALPTVYLQADKYYDYPAYGRTTRVGITLEGSVEGMGLSAIGRSRAAGERLQASRDDLDATRNDVRRTLKSFYSNRLLQQALMVSQRQAVTETGEILASFQRQYDAGRKAWLDVLNMQREFADQQLQQIQAENDWLIYSLRLMALTGGLDRLAGLEKEE